MGHIELVDWLEGKARELDTLYEEEFTQLNLSCVFDYEITEALGAWLYHEGEYGDFVTKARELVAIQVVMDERLHP
jgi:hypothetical protein